MRKSALHVNNCRNFSAHNLAVVKADPMVVKADPMVVKADPVVVKADPVVVKADPVVVKAGPAVVKVAQVRAAALVDVVVSGRLIL